MQEINTLKDKELLDDMLTAQKHVTQNYSMFANECSTKEIRSDIMNLLKDEHEIQAELFDEMSSRGWYKVEEAEMQKIDKAKQKFMKFES